MRNGTGVFHMKLQSQLFTAEKLIIKISHAIRLPRVNFIYQVLNFPHCRYGKIPVIHCLIIQKYSQSSNWGQWSQEWEFCVLPKKKFNQWTDRSQGQFQKGLQKYEYMNGCGIFWPNVSYPTNFFRFENSRNQQTKKISKENNPVISCTAQVQEQ